MKARLDQVLVQRGLVTTRSQAENYVKLGLVKVNSIIASKPNQPISDNDKLKLTVKQQYVSRAALKLASVAAKLGLDFRGQIILDVGSSTGGFTDYALQHGAAKVIAIDVGTDQLHPHLRTDPRVELYEQTDIRDFNHDSAIQIDMVLIDVSFISLRDILPAIIKLTQPESKIVAMVKPQFEAGTKTKNKGVIKNYKIRRNILKNFEIWVQKLFIIVDKADSSVAGVKGNIERFYVLRMST